MVKRKEVNRLFNLEHSTQQSHRGGFAKIQLLPLIHHFYREWYPPHTPTERLYRP